MCWKLPGNIVYLPLSEKFGTDKLQNVAIGLDLISIKEINSHLPEFLDESINEN